MGMQVGNPGRGRVVQEALPAPDCCLCTADPLRVKCISLDRGWSWVLLTKYLKRANYAFFLAEYEEQRLAYRDYEVPMRDMLLLVGYMQPLLSNRGRNIFAYLGLSAFGGYEELNEEKSLLPDGATLVDRSHLVYGGAVHSASSRIGYSSSSRLSGTAPGL